MDSEGTQCHNKITFKKKPGSITETLILNLNFQRFSLRTDALLSKYQSYIKTKVSYKTYLYFSFLLGLCGQFSQTLHFFLQLFILLLKFQPLFTDKGALFSFWIQNALQFTDNFLATRLLFLRAEREEVLLEPKSWKTTILVGWGGGGKN